MSVTVNFTDQSTPGPSGPIASWAWDFGDGGTSTLENPSHNYSTYGTYTVTLVVTGSGSDGTATNSHVVTLTNPVSLAAAFTVVASALVITLTDHSIAGPSGPITAWAWNFGDGNTSTTQNPTHTYSASGTYTITLVVTGTNPDGTSTVTHSVTVSSGVGSIYQPYTPASAINQKIPSSPTIHPSSASMISAANYWLLGGTSSDAYKEWVGPRQRAIYFRGDPSSLPQVPIYVNFVAGTGYVCASSPKMTMPMPSWFASILSSNNVSQDRNVVIVDDTTGDVWETWHVTPPNMATQNVSCSTSRWNAIVANLYTADTVSHTGYDGSIYPFSPGAAAKIHYPAGLMVPEDFADLTVGSVIPHALRLTSKCGSTGATWPKFVLPARGGDGRSSIGIPYGARVQLNPSLNIETWPSVLTKSQPWRGALIKILKTLQVYGLILTDGTAGTGAGGLEAAHPSSVVQGTYNGGTGFKYPWDTAGYGWSYKNGIPYDLMSHFRVIDWNVWTGA